MIRRAFLLVLVLGVSPLVAAGYGKFHFGKVTFEPIDAFAYQVEVAKKPVTIVILTDFKINRPAALAEINTPGAFIVQAADKGSLVIVKLEEPGKCGVGAFLGPTQKDVGLGESNPAKTTVSTSSRIAGECSTSKPGKMFDDEYDFHLTYDVPITAVPKPAKLPEGGGEAGAAYVALVKAIQTSNWEVAHAHLSPEQSPAQRPKDMKSFFEGLALNYPKTVTVNGGLVKGDRANIEVHGVDHDGKKIKGLVALKKVGGQWQVLEQNFYFDQS
jgi:hypothetical protein